jgi:hypothetical protein
MANDKFLTRIIFGLELLPINTTLGGVLGMRLRRIVSLAAVVCAFTAQSVLASEKHEGNACQMIPPNSQFYGVGFAGGITEKTFNAVIDAAIKIYTPIFKAKGATFEVVRLWDDGTVNAYAEQEGNVWKVSMFGGLARHPETTPDGFAEVICHEIGHHLGGAPKYSGMSWAAVEGQADYFATLKCMHKMIAKLQDWPAFAPAGVDPLVTQRCNDSYPSNATENKICVRSAYGGFALAKLLANLGGEPVPAFNTPDKSKVSRTIEYHPPGQCRLDTYFNGAVCSVDPNVETSQDDEKVGVCTGVASVEDRTTTGARPGCWYTDTPTDDGSGDDQWPVIGSN